MIRRASRVTICALTLAAPSAAPAAEPAAPSASSLLAQVLRGPTVAFEGRQRTEAGAASALVQVACDGKGRMRREYVSGAGAGLVTIEAGRSSWQRGVDGKWLRLQDAAAPADPTATAAAILRNYTVTAGRQETVAGRPAIPVRIAHRQTYNPSRNVWLDRATGIVLKDILLAPDGRVRSSSEFTAISLKAQPAELFRPPTSAPAPALAGPSSFQPRGAAAKVEQETGRSVPAPAHVPPGYRVALYGVMHTGSGRAMPAVRYSDGLAAFTIFERGWGAGMGRGAGAGMGMGMGMGPRGRGRGMRWQGGRGTQPAGPICTPQSTLQASVVAVNAAQANYLLVGDLAESELMKVAKSLP